jgi:hypothetical protein
VIGTNVTEPVEVPVEPWVVQFQVPGRIPMLVGVLA